MRRELIISYASHGVLILIFFFASAFSRPKVPPAKVYMVKVIAAVQPKVVEQPEKRVEEKPKEVVKAEPKPTKRHRKPKPKKVEKPKIEPKKTSPTGKGHITVDGSDFADDFYLNLVYMKVYRNWIPPAIGREIDATIYFTILRDGRVKDAKVEKRSGISSFDQSALRTVLSSSPFPELPDSYSGDHLGIHFEFVHNP